MRRDVHAYGRARGKTSCRASCGRRPCTLALAWSHRKERRQPLGHAREKPGKQACAGGSNRPTGHRVWLLDLAARLKTGLNCRRLGSCCGLPLGLKFGLKWVLNLGSNGP